MDISVGNCQVQVNTEKMANTVKVELWNFFLPFWPISKWKYFCGQLAAMQRTSHVFRNHWWPWGILNGPGEEWMKVHSGWMKFWLHGKKLFFTNFLYQSAEGKWSFEICYERGSIWWTLTAVRCILWFQKYFSLRT